MKRMGILDICRDRLPELLTVANCVGVGVTAWLTHRGTRKADLLLSKEYQRRLSEGDETPISLKEEAKLTWRCYILPVTVGAVTIGSAVASNRVSAKRLSEAVAIGALYADRVQALEGKIEEKLGKEELDKVKEEVKKDQLMDNRERKMLCYEPESKQWFRATQQDLLMAEIVANKMFQNNGKITLNQWLQLLPNCKPVDWGERWGWWVTDPDGTADFNWSFYRGEPWIDIQPILEEDKFNGRQYLRIGYGMHPMEQYDNQILRDTARKGN